MLTREQFSEDQKRGCEFLKARPAALLWADVGTGKTVTALTAVRDLRETFDCHKVLVIAPKRVAWRVWSDEVTKWAHIQGLRVSRIVGTEQDRLAAMQVDADVYTLTRDNVHWLERQIIHTEFKIDPYTQEPVGIKSRKQIRRWPWDTVILDESQSFMHQSSQRFKSLRMLRQLFPRIYLLSASVMPNGYPCLWSQLYLIDGGQRLGNNEKAFYKRWFNKEVNDGVTSYELKKGAALEIERAIADVVYIMADPQPPVEKNFIRVTLSPKEMAAYRAMERTSVLRYAGQEITAVNAGVLYGKLLQLANGAIYHDEDGNWTHIHDQKIEALFELLEELPKPVLIGYGFKHDLQRLLNEGNKRKLGKFAVLKSDASLDAWRRGEIDYGIIHPASAGHGLNDLYVSGSENIVWFGFTNNLEFYEQLNGRLAGGHRRRGKNVIIHHIMADDTIDEDAKALLEFKDGQQASAKIRLAAMRLKEKYGAKGSSDPGCNSNPRARGPSIRQAAADRAVDYDRDGLDWLRVS